MTRSTPHVFDPDLDLVLERTVDVPKELVWKAWTTPEIMKKWFAPAPWTTVDCEIDPRPGGIFRTVMRSPEGKEFPGTGCCLEVVENERLVWTTVLGPGYRPSRSQSASADDNFSFTAVISVEAHNGGTKYTALVIHGDPQSRKKHEDMGFHVGWGIVFDQLVAVVKAS
jgi:uncharacterized protein YndB with AHSA1/START domain